MNLIKGLLPLVTLLLVAETSVHASTLSAIGGLDFGRNSGMNALKMPLPLLGAEYMLGLVPQLEFGAIAEENFLSYQSGESGSFRFLGVQARFHVFAPDVGPFVDGAFGFSRRMQGENSSGNRLAPGGGIGYEIPMSAHVGLAPHVGVRLMPDAVNSPGNSPVVDGALMFSVHF